MVAPAYRWPVAQPSAANMLGVTAHLVGSRHDESRCLPAIIIGQYGVRSTWYDDRWSRGGCLFGIIGTSQTMYHTEYHTEWECAHRHPDAREKHVVKPEEAILWIPQPGSRRNRQGSGPRTLRPLSSATIGDGS